MFIKTLCALALAAAALPAVAGTPRLDARTEKGSDPISKFLFFEFGSTADFEKQELGNGV